MSRKPNPAAKRLQAARKKAAEALGLDVTDWRSRRYGMLSIALTNLENALADGHRIDIRQLVEIESAMQEIVASLPKEPVKVTIEMVDSGIAAPLDWSPKPVIDTAEQSVEIEAPVPVEAAAPIPVPPPRLDPGVSSASGFHNQIVGGERAPLKRLENVALQNNGHARSGAFENYSNAGPMCWTGYQGRQNGGVTQPDPNPSFHSDGSVRKPYEPPH